MFILSSIVMVMVNVSCLTVLLTVISCAFNGYEKGELSFHTEA